MQITCCVSEKVYRWFQKRKTIYIYIYIYMYVYNLLRNIHIYSLIEISLDQCFLTFFLHQGCAKEIMKTTEQWIHRKTH